MVQFLSDVSVAGKTAVEAAAQLGLPFGIILVGAPAKVFRQFQPFVGGQSIHSLLQFGNTHETQLRRISVTFQGPLDLVSRKPGQDFHSRVSISR